MPKITEINKSLGELEEELEKIKSASKMIEDAKNTTAETISETKKIMSDLIKKAKEATDSAIKESKKLNKAAEKLLDMVTTLMEKLDDVDFPIRLDKIDATIGGINSGIQNILSRFDSVERNLKDDISILNQKLDKTHKVNLYLLVGILLMLGSFITGYLYTMDLIF